MSCDRDISSCYKNKTRCVSSDKTIIKTEEGCPVRSEKTYFCPEAAGGPSLGLTLVLSVFMFGLDRFYVGQIGTGIALLIGSISIIGLIVVIPVYIIAQISLIMAILTNRTCAFTYGDVVFEPPNIVDKIIAVSWLTLMIVGILISIIGGILI